MAETLPRKKEYDCGRYLMCLLLIGLFLILFAGTGYCESDRQGVNSSGNRNIAPSIDPFRKSEGFSAVLYNNVNGLPTSEANAIAQTDEGFLWIGSYAGLFRYDGNTFERLDSTTGIANVRCLFVDSCDRLWIGTNDSGVFLMTKGQCRKWDKTNGLSSASIRAIAEDGEGCIYIAGVTAGIAMLDTELNLAELEDSRIDGKTVLELRRDSNGIIYGFTSEGDLLALKNGELIRYLGHDGCRVKDINSIMPDPEHPGRLYLGTQGSKIFYGDLENGFSSLGIQDIAPLSSVVDIEYINGQIWICAGNGIGRIDSEGFHMLKNLPMDSSLEQVMTDYEGNLWFASSRQGVMKVVPDRFSNLFERYDLPAAVVNSTCIYGRQLFMGTDTGLIVTEEGRTVDSIPLTKAVTASGKELEAGDLLELLDGVRIRSITHDSKGQLWIATWHRYGLLRYDQGDLLAFTQEDGLFSNGVRVVSECEDGSILVANTGGVSIIRDDSVTDSCGVEDGLVNGEILTVTEGFNHELILGSDGGGIYIVRSDGIGHIGTEDGLSSEIILRIKRSCKHEIYWIVTSNSLSFMTPDYQVTTVRQFPYPNNFDLYENSKGDIWVLSSAGIFVVPEEELLANGPIEPVFLGIQSGFPYAATANSYSELTADGDLYIASTSGTVQVNIEKPFKNFNDLKIDLPYIEADGKSYYPDGADKFTVPANTKKLTIYPRVFNYSLIDPQISYRLEGFDTETATVSRSELMPVDYTNLKIGTYQFILAVRDPIEHTEQTVSFPIVKGKEMTVDMAGTIIMDIASLFLMGGILVYTSVYRKRGRLEDKLFFVLTLINAAMVVGELLSYGLENSTYPLVKELMIAGNTVLFIALVGFPYLLFQYLGCYTDPDRAGERKNMLLYGIPFFLFFAVMLVNLKTGWIFSIDEGNTYCPGFLDEKLYFPQLFALFYLLLSLFRLYQIDIRMAAFGILLILDRLLWEVWFQGISLSGFMYTLFLAWMHIYAINRPLAEAKT